MIQYKFISNVYVLNSKLACIFSWPCMLILRKMYFLVMAFRILMANSELKISNCDSCIKVLITSLVAIQINAIKINLEDEPRGHS